MWDKLVLIGQSLAAMVSHDKAPPNTPPQYVEEMKSINFLRSKKFFVVFSSIIMLLLFFGVSTFILFLTAPLSATITSSFVTIFVETLKIFAIIISAYLGLQAAIDFKFNSDSSVTSENRTEYEESKNTVHYIEEYLSGPKEEDYIVVLENE